MMTMLTPTSGRDEKEFWADEVRLSLRSKTPDVLFASTRGLEAHTKGFLAAYELRQDGFFANPSEALRLWQTPTVSFFCFDLI